MLDNPPDRGFQRRWYTRTMNWYRDAPFEMPLFNPTVRSLLRAKLAYDRIRVQRYCSGREADVDRWLGGLRMFFGFSSIRAGTVALTNMLKLELDDAHVEHEANLDDYWTLPDALKNPSAAEAYVREFRRFEIYYRAPRAISVYGEINPMLRLHCGAFKQVFPEAACFQIVRNPRAVIRSIMGKENLGSKDPFKDLIRPPGSDPYHDAWRGMSRFERVCWMWQYENRRMRTTLGHTLQFERLLADFDYFRRELLDFIGVEVSEAAWDRYATKPRNATRGGRFPHWSEWDASQMQAFRDICGDEMAHYGYEE